MKKIVSLFLLGVITLVLSNYT